MNVVMGNVVLKTVIFGKPGSQNTAETMRLALKRSKELAIHDVVVASVSGSTGVKASKTFRNHNLVVVSHVTGFREPNVQTLSEENRKLIEKNGGQIVTAAHAFGSVGRAVHRKFGAIQADELVASVLRLFGEGTKVACEIACMAADAGLISTSKTMVSIGGTSRGADTAIVMKPSNTHTFFETRIMEIICKPSL